MSGKAPPLPEMTISGLTESGLSGSIRSPNQNHSPALPDVAARPSGGLFRFWALCLQRLGANHFAPSRIPHRGRSAVKHCAARHSAVLAENNRSMTSMLRERRAEQQVDAYLLHMGRIPFRYVR